MKHAFFTWAILGFVGAAAACAASPPPEAQAARVEHEQCDASRSGDEGALLRDVQVLRAQPLYSHIITRNNDTEDRVVGARLVVRPPPGVTAETLTRALQCHSARALLGQVDTTEFGDDPFWLPGAWLDIEVKSEDGNFAVELRANSVAEGLKTFHSATAFAEAHPVHVAP